MKFYFRFRFRFMYNDGMPFCICLPNFVVGQDNRRRSYDLWRHVHFSRWRPAAISDLSWVMLDHTWSAIIGLSLDLKFGLDPIYSVWDIFCRFGLKLPIHDHFGGCKVNAKVKVDLYTVVYRHVVNTPLRRSAIMARVLKGSHRFTCTHRVHPLTEWTNLPSQPKLVPIYQHRRVDWLTE